MNISKFKLIMSGIWGFLDPFGSAVGSMISYILEVVRAAANAAMQAMDYERKAKVQKWFEVTKVALNWLYKLQPYVPTKWQVEYKETVEAVQTCYDAISDFNITECEMLKIEKEVNEAIEAWEKD